MRNRKKKFMAGLGGKEEREEDKIFLFRLKITAVLGGHICKRFEFYS